ncbi:hypothetical protein BKA70DRAFT_1223941 [Coprinopsis sp. MPI-PUGE-AT-0042]|nr:hypothetical protein BKA70DRAFT_1223941 [Coprinopsis sp. MPI-PUGE-AT-0042]
MPSTDQVDATPSNSTPPIISDGNSSVPSLLDNALGNPTSVEPTLDPPQDASNQGTLEVSASPTSSCYFYGDHGATMPDACGHRHYSFFGTGGLEFNGRASLEPYSPAPVGRAAGEQAHFGIQPAATFSPSRHPDVPDSAVNERSYTTTSSYSASPSRDPAQGGWRRDPAASGNKFTQTGPDPTREEPLEGPLTLDLRGSFATPPAGASSQNSLPLPAKRDRLDSILTLENQFEATAHSSVVSAGKHAQQARTGSPSSSQSASSRGYANASNRTFAGSPLASCGRCSASTVPTSVAPPRPFPTTGSSTPSTNSPGLRVLTMLEPRSGATTPTTPASGRVHTPSRAPTSRHVTPAPPGAEAAHTTGRNDGDCIGKVEAWVLEYCDGGPRVLKPNVPNRTDDCFIEFSAHVTLRAWIPKSHPDYVSHTPGAARDEVDALMGFVTATRTDLFMHKAGQNPEIWLQKFRSSPVHSPEQHIIYLRGQCCLDTCDNPYEEYHCVVFYDTALPIKLFPRKGKGKQSG